MTVTSKKIDSAAVAEFVELLGVFAQAFERDVAPVPPVTYLQQLLGEDSFWGFVALSDQRVIGGLTAYVLPQYYAQRPLVYLYDLAVLPGFQRRGVGRQLLTALTDYARLRGVEEVFVQADSDDPEAIDFYRATGGLAQSVMHFTYPLGAPDVRLDQFQPDADLLINPGRRSG